jgi:hypothetical protein
LKLGSEGKLETWYWRNRGDVGGVEGGKLETGNLILGGTRLMKEVSRGGNLKLET